jgi:hypothetical protein
MLFWVSGWSRKFLFVRYGQEQRQQKAGEIATKRLMSAFGGKADINRGQSDVCF